MKSLSFFTSSDTRIENQNSHLTLASASQDGYIRLWLIKALVPSVPDDADSKGVVDELMDAFEKSLGEIDDDTEGGKTITSRSHILSVIEGGSRYQSFVAATFGHAIEDCLDAGLASHSMPF